MGEELFLGNAGKDKILSFRLSTNNTLLAGCRPITEKIIPISLIGELPAISFVNMFAGEEIRLAFQAMPPLKYRRRTGLPDTDSYSFLI